MSHEFTMQNIMEFIYATHLGQVYPLTPTSADVAAYFSVSEDDALAVLYGMQGDIRPSMRKGPRGYIFVWTYWNDEHP